MNRTCLHNCEQTDLCGGKDSVWQLLARTRSTVIRAAPVAFTVTSWLAMEERRSRRPIFEPEWFDSLTMILPYRGGPSRAADARDEDSGDKDGQKRSCSAGAVPRWACCAGENVT